MQDRRYSCDENGIVYAHTVPGPRILGQIVLENGYRRVTLSKVPERLDCLTHQFVWLFFNGLYPPDLQINHIDGKKLNNHLSNLELVTAAENREHAKLLGLYRKQDSELNPQAKLTWEKVFRIRAMHARGVPQARIARKFKVSIGAISRVVLHKGWVKKEDGDAAMRS